MFEKLLSRAWAVPEAGSVPLCIAGQPCGLLAPDVPPLLAGIAHARGEDGAFMLLSELQRTLPGPGLAQRVSGLLDQVARALLDQGRLNGWRNELLDVVSESGTSIGTVERAAVRPLGIATHAVHLNAWTRDGRLWISRRALTKNTDPGLWDTLVGGLISAGESPESALARESWEEAGLQPADLAPGLRTGVFTVRRRVPEGFQLERVVVHDVVLEDRVVPCNQDGEADLIRPASVDEVLDLIRQERFTLEAGLSILTSLLARGAVLPVSAAARERIGLRVVAAAA